MRKRRKSAGRKVRVPNPAKAPKGRLDAPAERVHGSGKAYKRRPKHRRGVVEADE